METGSLDQNNREPQALKWAAVTCFLLAALVMGTWIAMGASFVTQYQVASVEVTTDEFGDEIETTVMRDEFQFGLLPDKGYDAAAPIAGVFTALGSGLLILGWRRRKKENA